MDKHTNLNLSGRKHARVIIVGAGPAGIGAAVALARKGVRPVVLIDRASNVGGMPALCKKKPGAVPTFVSWLHGRALVGEQFVAGLEARLAEADVEVWLDNLVVEIHAAERRVTVASRARGKLDISADAIVLACGSRERSVAERGWLTGSRPARVFFTKHLFDFIDGNDILPIRRSIIVGSDSVAYSAAAKLSVSGAGQSVMLGKLRRPECNFLQRLYFNFWSRPKWHGSIQEVQVKGLGSVEGVKISDKKVLTCDSIVVCGDLIPNTELALLGGLEVHLPSRLLDISSGNRLSSPGWFAAGNIRGGFHSAQWCYLNGKKVARSVLKYLA
ncbi:MAG: FAD-dependent oxidoreductase [Planctomycetota bacterium]|jgi:thioredoxin reductase